MKWLRAFFLLFVLLSNILLAAQEQAQRKDQAQAKDAPGWVFPYAINPRRSLSPRK